MITQFHTWFVFSLNYSGLVKVRISLVPLHDLSDNKEYIS